MFLLDEKVRLFSSSSPKVWENAGETETNAQRAVLAFFLFTIFHWISHTPHYIRGLKLAFRGPPT